MKRKAFRLSIGSRLSLSFGTILGVVAVLGAVGVLGMLRMAAQLKSSLDGGFEAVSAAGELRVASQGTQTLLSTEAAQGIELDPTKLQERKTQFTQALARLSASGAPKGEVDALDRQIASVLDDGQAMVQAASAQQWLESGKRTARFREGSTQLLGQLEKLERDQKAEVAARLSTAEEQIRHLAFLLSLGIAFATALGFWLAWSMRRKLVTRLTRLAEVTTRITEDGDLTQEIDIETGDEIGALGEAFSQMVARLREITGKLRGATDQLSRSAVTLGQATSRQSEMITQQATAIQETQVTAQEIQQTSSLAARKAETVLEVAERAGTVSSSGEAAIDQSLSALSEMREQVEEISRKIGALDTLAHQIGGITQTVKNLADQSNMLALNAAIEAVRAGDHGKGFGIVAREIRSLADQSIRATHDVRELLDEIGSAIRESVAITTQNAKRMEGGLVQMRSSGENLRELSSIVKDNISAMRQIAAAVGQQNAGIAQVFTAVKDLSKAMDETVKSLDSTNAAAGVIREVSTVVEAVARTYKV